MSAAEFESLVALFLEGNATAEQVANVFWRRFGHLFNVIRRRLFFQKGYHFFNFFIFKKDTRFRHIF